MGAKVCPWWLAYTFDNPLRHLFHKPERIFAPYITEGMTAADIGCGLGYFTIGLAQLVGKDGKVIGLDIQEEMLARAEKRAARAGVAEAVEFRRCTQADIRLQEPLDFALAFWVVHEVPDIPSLFRQICIALKPKGLLFIAEPKFHVSRSQFLRETEAARLSGLEVKRKPEVMFSYAALFEKNEGSQP